jgi:hypothetical protein
LKTNDEIITTLWPPDSGLDDAVQQHERTLREVAGKTTTEIDTFKEDVRAQALETGLRLDGPLSPGRLLLNAAVDAATADARGEAFDPTQIQRWNEETRADIHATYGTEHGDELITRARKFVQQHPKLATLVNRRGIGSRPAVVRALVDHVRRTNFR